MTKNDVLKYLKNILTIIIILGILKDARSNIVWGVMKISVILMAFIFSKIIHNNNLKLTQMYT